MNYHLRLLTNIRTTLLKEIENLSLEQLNYIPKTHKNNIIWNVGHCLVIQQLLCYSLASVHCRVEKDILIKFKNGSFPDGMATQEEVDAIKKMLIESIEQLEQDLANDYFQEYKSYTVGFGTRLTSVQEAIIFNNAHEGLHYGYILALKKLL